MVLPNSGASLYRLSGQTQQQAAADNRAFWDGEAALWQVPAVGVRL